MSVSSICPDDLLLAARRGELTKNDDARLAFHLERCPRCRAALSAGRAFDVVLGARIGDDEIARRIAARVTERKTRRFWPLALGAGFLLTASLAVAAVGVQRLRHIFEAAQDVATLVPSESEKSRGFTRRTAAAVSGSVVPASTLSPATELRALADEAAQSALGAPATSAAAEPNARAARGRTSALRGSTSAAELFAQANALRGGGKSQEAQKRYFELQAQYPESSEARVSLVSLGRLELAKQPAQALRHFNAYLAQASHQTLYEEALFGQATALARLGKVEQERAAWRKLLDRYPSSVYAERAKARLTP